MSLKDLTVDRAIEVLKKGGVVVFPTETAYGIGCRMDDKKAVRRLIEIRRRKKGKPFLVLVSSIEMAKKYLLPFPLEVEKLMRKFWPGPLTIVYFCKKEIVPSLVRAGKETLAVRMSSHKIVLKLIEGVGTPVLGPSANFSGEKTPYKFFDLDEELTKSVDFVLKAPCGKYKRVSSVINCTQKPWQILREGAVKKEEIFDIMKTERR